MEALGPCLSTGGAERGSASGIGSASLGSKASVWSRRRSPWGGQCAGEMGGAVGQLEVPEDPVISVAMDARGRDEASEPLEELERREHELGAAVGRRLG